MESSPNLDLPYVMPAQAQKHVTHNEAIRALDAIVQLSVLDRDLTQPPEGPTEGQRHIVAGGATGPWAGKDGTIAAFQDGGWIFLVPGEGWTSWIADEDVFLAWDGLEWVAAGGAVNPAPLIGINAMADTFNRLALRSPASLFNHEGAGHQLKINKAAAADTASLLYQTGFSGRAEMGLAGSDDLHVKVSADGENWQEAVVVKSDSGRVGLGTDVPQGRLHCQVADGDGGIAFRMTGQGRDGPDDPDHGAAFVLSHNGPGNRQFTLADTESGLGIRVIGNSLDGYNFHTGTREALALGTGTSDIYVGNDLNIAGAVHVQRWARLSSYTVATLPSAAVAGAGALIYVDDEAGGSALAFCDGTHWRRVTDRAMVS